MDLNSEEKKLKIVVLGDGFYLRALTVDDCSETYLSWLNDVEINQYLETRHWAQDIDAIKAFVQSSNSSNDTFLFGIFIDILNLHIGNIKIGPIHPIYKHADMSYFIGDKRYHGKGLMSNVIKEIQRFAFDQLGLIKLKAGVTVTNTGSEKCLLKNGFNKVAQYRNEVLNIKNEWEDVLVLECLKESEKQ